MSHYDRNEMLLHEKKIIWFFMFVCHFWFFFYQEINSQIHKLPFDIHRKEQILQNLQSYYWKSFNRKWINILIIDFDVSKQKLSPNKRKNVSINRRFRMYVKTLQLSPLLVKYEWKFIIHVLWSCANLWLSPLSVLPLGWLLSCLYTLFYIVWWCNLVTTSVYATKKILLFCIKQNV